MYYRRKVLLGLLEIFDNKLSKTNLQKLLMLFSKQQTKPSYEFVPYKYGCFSFQSNADLKTMIKYNQVVETKNTQTSYWEKKEDKVYFKELKLEDKLILNNLYSKFKDYSTNELVKYSYVKYPYYAINSKIYKEILSDEQQKEIESHIPVNNISALYTIGYEGITQEQYLNRLIKANVGVLCDVRRNAISMKYGFSKNQLSRACEGLGIDYVHLPEVGIQSSKRKKLETQSDYDELFNHYKEGLDNSEIQTRINTIRDLLDKKKRVAITCFEANIDQCHRKHLAFEILNENSIYDLIHL